MVDVTFGNYTLSWSDQDLPLLYDFYCQEAKLVEVFDTPNPEGNWCFVGLRHLNKLELVVSQRYSPGSDSGFNPGILLIAETNLLFIGAGERLLAYKLDPLERLWENKTDAGFWGWERFDRFVIMSAELELAVWNIYGEKLWSTFVEPPWDYYIEQKNNILHLDVMGKKTSFPLQTGP